MPSAIYYRNLVQGGGLQRLEAEIDRLKNILREDDLHPDQLRDIQDHYQLALSVYGQIENERFTQRCQELSEEASLVARSCSGMLNELTAIPTADNAPVYVREYQGNYLFSQALSPEVVLNNTGQSEGIYQVTQINNAIPTKEDEILNIPDDFRAGFISCNEYYLYNGIAPQLFDSSRQVTKEEFIRAINRHERKAKMQQINRLVRLVPTKKANKDAEDVLRSHYVSLRALKNSLKMTVNSLVHPSMKRDRDAIKETVNQRLKSKKLALKEHLQYNFPKAQHFYYEVYDKKLGADPLLVGPYSFKTPANIPQTKEGAAKRLTKDQMQRWTKEMMKQRAEHKRDIIKAINNRRAKLRNVHTDVKVTRRFNIRYEMKGGVFTASNSILELMKTLKVRKVTTDKKPLSKENHVGVEIECFLHDASQESLADALLAAKLESKVCVKDDGSLNTDDGGESFELTICDTESNIEETVKEVCKVIQSFDGYVNQTCGLHVHLDMRTRSVRDASKRLIASQPLLFTLVPHTRRRNSYCKPTHPDQTVNATGERYKAVNLASYDAHSTIEIRLHTGTVEADKINNWVKLLIKIADTPIKDPNQLKTLKDWAKTLVLSKELTSYMEKRAAKFYTNEEKEKGLEINYQSFMSKTRYDDCDEDGSRRRDCDECGNTCDDDDMYHDVHGHDYMCASCYDTAEEERA